MVAALNIYSDDNRWISDHPSVKRSPSVSLDEKKGSGIFGGTVNLANAALGAGLLTFPHAFASTGIAFGLFLQVLFSAFLYGGLMIFAETAKLTNADSFAVTCSRLLGHRRGYLANFQCVSYSWCACVMYLTVIGTQLEVFGRIVGDVDEGNSVVWYLEPMFTTIIVGTVVVYPLTSMREIRSLSSASFIAVASCWYVTLFVVISYFVSDPMPPCDHCLAGYSLDFQGTTFWAVAGAIPGMCFGYQCNLASVPIYAELAPKAKSRYSYVAVAVCLVCFATYATIGMFGALTFGGCAATKNLILDNYPRDNLPANVGRVCVALAVATSYPIVAYGGRLELSKVLDVVVAKQGMVSESNLFLGTANRRLFWLGNIWYISTLFFAIFVPNIKWVVNLTGTVCAAAMFIFPGVFAMKLAYLCNEESIDNALLNLPDGAREDFPDSWAFGIRNRITHWLDRRHQRALWWFGVVLLVVGVVMLTMCVLIFGKDVADEMNKISALKPVVTCDPPL
eukprot:GEMP01020190.1.p1 GENE.GEMP01020190.1~~GEMP01020190.1.p1  ORF type:complete len:508 (+),score=49.42 GEMP01020190.1:31-1554(+)